MEGGVVKYNFERGPPRTIPAQFVLSWLSRLREELNVQNL